MTTDASFIMTPKKMGKLLYLVMTMFIPLVFLMGIELLIENGILPNTKLVAMIELLFWFVLLMWLGNLFVFKKNHIIEVTNAEIIETDIRRKTTTIRPSQIHSCRRNILNELLLLDEEGKTILCIEAHMENIDLFKQWLNTHHISYE